MRYYRITVMTLMALCLSGTAIVAQVSREWKKTSGPYGAEISALALDKDGGAYAVASRGNTYYAPPTEGPVQWQVLGDDLPPAALGGSGWKLAVSGDAGSRTVFAAGRNTLFRLTQGSGSWTPINSGLGNDYIESIVANAAGTVFCTTIGGKLFRLNKDATVWEELQTPFEDPSDMVIGTSDALLVSVAYGGVIRSTDNGATWTTVTEQDIKPGFSIPARLASSPSGNVYYLYKSFRRSTDNGTTWSNLPPTPIYTVNILAVGSNEEIYVGTVESGFYMRQDGAMTWTQPVPDLDVNIVSAIAAGDRCYVASEDMVFRTMDHGTTWQHAVRGLEYSSTELIDVNAQGVIAAVHRTRLSVSTDRGTTWMDRGALNATAIRWDNNGELLMGAGNILKRSTDSGITWTTVHTTNQVIRDIEIDGLRRISLLVAGELGIPGSAQGQGKLLFSPDNGATWTQGNTGLPADSPVADITPGPFGTLFAAVNIDGIYRSLDGGRTWEKFHDIHPETSFRKIAVHYGTGDIIAVGAYSISRYSQQPSQSYDLIFDAVECFDVTSSTTGYTVVATTQGVMVSADGSDQFAFESQAPTSPFLCVDVDAEGRFYAGLEQNGVWYTESDIVASAGDNTGRSRVSPAIVLSPNPAADHLTVQYTLTEGRTVAIGLHDTSGRTVRDTPAAYQEAGDHTIDLNLGDLPAGTYFVGLKLGNVTSATAPFVIRR